MSDPPAVNQDFVTCSLSAVAAQLDRTVVSAVLTVVLTSLEVHMKNVAVVVWGCKALSQLSPHGRHESVSPAFFFLFVTYS